MPLCVALHAEEFVRLLRDKDLVVSDLTVRESSLSQANIAGIVFSHQDLDRQEELALTRASSSTAF